MSVTTEVKKVSRSRWTIFIVGAIVGASLLSVPIMWLFSKVAPELFTKLTGLGAKLVPNGTGGGGT